MDCPIQTGRHAGEVLPEYFPRVPSDNCSAVGRGPEGPFQSLPECGARIQRSFGDAQSLEQLREPLAITIETGNPVLVQRSPGDVIGDERIAVAIAADPGAELQERRNDESLLRPDLA